jgi:hypothetical protein
VSSSRPDRGPRRRGRATLILLIAVLGAACVRPDDPKVAVTKVEASLVFGVKPPPQPVAPALPEQAPATVEAPAATAPPLPFPDLAFRPLPPASAPARSECPPASPTAVADRPADIRIGGEPRVGRYRWKREGALTGFERRIVRNVKPEGDKAYTFETVQPTVGRPTVTVKTFRVKTEPVTQGANPGGLMPPSRVGEPDRGVSLVRAQELDGNGNPVATFEPPSPLLLLPLPVQQGEHYESVAVDPRTGQTMVLDVTVQRRQRIDACGEVVDGWLVDGTLTDTAAGAESMEVAYIVATQLGGVLVQERFKAGEGDAAVDLTFTLGQVDPDPLPPGS